MKGKIISDWTKVNIKSKQDRKKIAGALQYFMSLPDRFIPMQYMKNENYKKRKAKLQAFTTPSDFPTMGENIIEKYHATPFYDNGYEQIFDVRDFSNDTVSGFDLLNVESGLTFAKVEIGDTADVYQMSGTRVRTYFDYYGAGLSWHRSLFEQKDYWTLEDTAIEFRVKAYQRRALIHYALIEAGGVAGGTVIWQAPDPAGLPNTDPVYTANRDAQTINQACINIINATLTKGYEVTPQGTTFIVLVPFARMHRIKKALSLVLQSFVGSKSELDFNVQLIPTTMLTSNDYYYVILPKRKMKAGYKMDLTMFSDFDILSYSDVTAGWMSYGSAIGDTDQLRRCALAT